MTHDNLNESPSASAAAPPRKLKGATVSLAGWKSA